MDPTVIAGVLAVVQSVLPSITTSAAVQTAIDALVKLVPIVVQFAPKLVADVKVIIDVLTSNPAALPGQVANLQKLSAQSDADFDAAAAQAAAADAAAGN